LAGRKNIYYVIESIEWVIAWEGKSISSNLKKLHNLNIKLLKSSRRRISRIHNQIIHFGSRNTYLPENYKYVPNTNMLVLTWYHGSDKDSEYINLLPHVADKLEMVHTSCTISRDKLVSWGMEPEKIKIIPIGIDVGHFKNCLKLDKSIVRKKLGIPDDAICIGSFQKDGDGWGEGLKPKMIKGPDIFCEVVKKLDKKYPVFVLLTGPARGYVKEQLGKAGIKYAHFYPRDNLKLPFYYRALDLYLVTSRVEGGPKAMMESFASKVPLISTDVGMVHDLAIDSNNAMVSKIDDVEGLVSNCEKVINDPVLKDKIIENGFNTVPGLDWSVLADSYYREIYSSLLDKE
jgi:glycosyltransferase involved in cell wall biosynthesis